MAFNSFSTYSVFLSNLSGFQKLQGSLNDLTLQLATLKKSTDLTTYGASGQRLLNLRADADKRQGYIQATTAASTDVKTYDQVFTQMETLTSNMLSAFTAPDSDPPTKQVNTVTFDGDLGDIGDIYKLTVDGRLFSYITNGTEGSYEEIAGNFARQINNANPPVRATATVKGDQLIITGSQPGPLYDVTVQIADVAGGETNTISQALTTAGKISPIVGQVSNALTTLQSLLNEQVNDRYLFGGQTINDIAPVIDLSRLPDPTGSKDSASDVTTQQLAGGTIRQQMRVTADELGTNQTETFSINGNNFSVTGPLTAQQVASQVASHYGPVLAPAVTVSDVDAQGFTLTASTPGTGFTATVTGTDPTPSVIDTVQPNVPIGPTQNDIIGFTGPLGAIGETYSVTITDPPAHTSPVTLTYRSTGNETSMDDVINALISSISTYQPPFGVTATALGNGQMRISGSTAFTSNAAVENTATVATTQRTVVAVAQEDQIGFPGMRGDTGDVYTINFTAPTAATFNVTTTSSDDQAAVAAKFAQQINAAGIGVTAAVKNGKLSLTSNTPGVPFTANAALTTDVGQPTPAPTQTNVVANIPPGATPQTDTVSFSGPAGAKGDLYQVTVNGRTVQYKTTGGEADMDAIVIQLASLINAANPPMGVSASPGPSGSGKLVITANTGGVALTTTSTITHPTVVTDPAPTDYNVHRATGDSDLSWDRAPLTLADDLTINYTFSANEPAIQRLVAALRIAQSAVTDPDQYADKMTKAQALARDALEGIRALHSINTVNDTLMSATTVAHQTQINVNTDGTQKIEGVDPNEVAAKIQNAQVQLQAVFSVVGSTSKLSLVNFLT